MKNAEDSIFSNNDYIIQVTSAKTKKYLYTSAPSPDDPDNPGGSYTMTSVDSDDNFEEKEIVCEQGITFFKDKKRPTKSQRVPLILRLTNNY